MCVGWGVGWGGRRISKGSLSLQSHLKCNLEKFLSLRFLIFHKIKKSPALKLSDTVVFLLEIFNFKKLFPIVLR